MYFIFSSIMWDPLLFTVKNNYIIVNNTRKEKITMK